MNGEPSAPARRRRPTAPMRTLVLGCGFSGLRVARELRADGDVVGTRRDAAGVEALERAGVPGVLLDATSTRAAGRAGDASARDPARRGTDASPPPLARSRLETPAREALARATHLVVCVAPARELPLVEPVLETLRPLGAGGGLSELRWIGYLSTIGVYGDHDGARVDEETPCRSRRPRSIARLEAEGVWRSLARELDVPLAILRLAGIYGPGRNAVRDALAGRARVLVKPGQVFNRVHVEDLARATAAAARRAYAGVLNVADDVPAPPQDVVRHAHALIGIEPPPAVPFERAELSPMARSFYAESKRVDNARSKRELGAVYRYPDYRAGLAALLEGELAAAQSAPRARAGGSESPSPSSR